VAASVNEYDKAPNPKHQPPEKHQNPSIKLSMAKRNLKFGSWSFFGTWSLDFGAFLFL
jgi:hypothetical protein